MYTPFTRQMQDLQDIIQYVHDAISDGSVTTQDVHNIITDIHDMITHIHDIITHINVQLQRKELWKNGFILFSLSKTVSRNSKSYHLHLNFIYLSVVDALNSL